MRNECVSTECFVCGRTAVASQTITVIGYTGRQGPPVIRLHGSCGPRLAAKILTTLEAPTVDSRDFDAIATLTTREIQVLRRLAAGDTNRAIARHLNLSEGHVKVRVSVVLSKLGVSSRAEAAVLGARAGLLDEKDGRE